MKVDGGSTELFGVDRSRPQRNVAKAPRSPQLCDGSEGEAVCVLALRPTARISRLACLCFLLSADGTLETTSEGAGTLSVLAVPQAVSEGSDWRHCVSFSHAVPT